MRAKTHITLFLAVMIGCKTSGSVSDTREIIGTDDRTAETDEYISKRAGYILGPASHCSASLISTDTVLTASHCIVEGRL